MSKLNPTVKAPKKPVVSKTVKLAGGAGAASAVQGPLLSLRRCVLANMLWEDLFYMDGQSVTKEIERLVPQCNPKDVGDLAVEARTVQKLRHTPLFLIVAMLKQGGLYSVHAEHAIPNVVTRPDQMSDLLALYFKENHVTGSKKHPPIAAALKRGLVKCFNNFTEFQFAKYDRDGEIKLRDVMFLVRPKPGSRQTALFKRIADRELKTPDTWEVALSSGADKRATWTRLIEEDKLGALAFLRNLRNMRDAGVNHNVIRNGFKNIRSQMLLPMNFINAAKNVPDFKDDINAMMLDNYKGLPKLPGYSIFVVDVSGSMQSGIGGKYSQLTRLDAACAMAMLALESCENVDIYLTAGSDGAKTHATKLLQYPKHGFDLGFQIVSEGSALGGGGIFTRQCIDYIKTQTPSKKAPDRIIVFSDSQDVDNHYGNKTLPAPFGKNNYIVDVSAHTHGINYKGVWTAELSGFSEAFLQYIAAFEGINQEFEVD
jgi:hypothetical protein